MSTDFEDQFAEVHRDELDQLEHGTEAERLHAIARLERACYASGGLGTVTRALVDRIEQDDSELVRAWAMRALLHGASEVWPTNPDLRQSFTRALWARSGSCGAPDFSDYVAWELLSILDAGFKLGRYR